MSRPHDIGGLEGFGPVPGIDDDARFHGDWEARVLGLQRVLLGNGTYTLDEHRDAVERVHPREYLAHSYYRRWMEAIILVLDEHGLINADQLVSE